MYRRFVFLIIAFFSLLPQEKINEKVQYLQKNYKYKLKDIVRVVDFRNNQLFGYGIVVGLKGTGDTKFATNREILSKVLDKMNIQIDLKHYEPRNIASVLVTAEILPFAKKGDRITCIVSSIGDAKSLEGGILIQTPLYGANGNVYAVAQGKLFTETTDSKIQEKITSALLPYGAIIERNLEDKDVSNIVRLQLKDFDIITLNTIYKFLKENYPSNNIKIDGGSIVLEFLENQNTLNEVSKILEEELLLPEKNKIVINQNTKMIVATGIISVKPFFLGRVFSNYKYDKIQREAFQGIYIRTPADNEELNQMIYIQANTMEELINEFNKHRLTIEEIISVFQSLIELGHIKAELLIR